MCCLFIFIVVMLCSCLLLCHIIYGDIIIVDLICCCIPFVILLTLFSPVFLLLYHLDVLIIPSTTVEILGNQWYWSYLIQFEDWWWCFKDETLSLYPLSLWSLMLVGDNRAYSHVLINFGCTYIHKPELILINEIQLDDILWSTNLSFSQSLIPTFNFTNFISKFCNYLLEINNLLLLPLFEIINSIVTSIDVIHSWSIYSFGSKIDAIPGRLNLAFTQRLFYYGINRGFCFELCGQGHYGMQIISLSSSFHSSSYYAIFRIVLSDRL